MADENPVDTEAEISQNSATAQEPVVEESGDYDPDKYTGVSWADEEPAEDAGPDDDEAPAEDGGEDSEDSGEPIESDEAPAEEAQKVPDRPEWLPPGFDRPEDVVAALQQAQQYAQQAHQYAQALYQQQIAGVVPAGAQRVQEPEGFRPPHQSDSVAVRAAADLLRAGTKERAQEILASLDKETAERALSRARYLETKRRAYDEDPDLELRERFAPLVRQLVEPIDRQYVAQQTQSFLSQHSDVLRTHDDLRQFQGLLNKGATPELALEHMKLQRRTQELASREQKVQSKAATQQAIKDQSRRGGRKRQRDGKRPENDDPFEWAKQQIKNKR